jgi:hypothetical protein
LSALGFKPTSQIGGGTNAGRALLEKIGSIPGAKTLGRALPGIGTVSGIYDVGSRLSQGDYFGAGLGALSAVPFGAYQLQQHKQLMTIAEKSSLEVETQDIAILLVQVQLQQVKILRLKL